jgi:hypothetical protein
VEQQEAAQEFRREEALMVVAIASIHDPEFLSGARTDLESTLWRYGFALSPQEMEEVRGYFEAKKDCLDQAIIDDLEAQLGPAQGKRWRFG